MILEKTIVQISEEDLIRLLRRKDKVGMEILYDRYASKIYGIIRQIIRYEDYAENVLNDSLLKVWKNIDSYNPNKGRFLTWMINIARNTAIDEVRSKRFSGSSRMTDFEDDNVMNPDFSYEFSIDNLDVKDIVNRLDDKYKNIIDLIYFGGYTQMEVSEELDIPLGTVKGRVRKAFHELRILLA